MMPFSHVLNSKLCYTEPAPLHGRHVSAERYNRIKTSIYGDLLASWGAIPSRTDWCWVVDTNIRSQNDLPFHATGDAWISPSWQGNMIYVAQAHVAECPISIRGTRTLFQDESFFLLLTCKPFTVRALKQSLLYLGRVMICCCYKEQHCKANWEAQTWNDGRPGSDLPI